MEDKQELKNKVWENASIVNGYSPTLFGKMHVEHI